MIEKNIKDDTVRIIKLECKEMEFEKEGGRGMNEERRKTRRNRLKRKIGRWMGKRMREYERED